MQCPYCFSQKINVLDSRDSENGQSIRRRRECEVCKRRFTTYERVDMRLPKVIKRDETREDFEGMKVRKSMEIALRKRPTPADWVDAAVSAVIQKATNLEDKEIASKQIGQWIMMELYKLDAVAFIRYASVYQSFKSIDDFNEALRNYFDHSPTLPDMQQEGDDPLLS